MIHAEADKKPGRLLTPASNYASGSTQAHPGLVSMWGVDNARVWSHLSGNPFKVLPQLARLPDGTVFVAWFCVSSVVVAWGF